jgi:hypothetical protein
MVRSGAPEVTSGDKKKWVHDPLLSCVRSRSGRVFIPLDRMMQAETFGTQGVFPGGKAPPTVAGAENAAEFFPRRISLAAKRVRR